MNSAEALHLAEQHVPDDQIVLADTIREVAFGFYFATDRRVHQESGESSDLPAPGTSGLLIDRETKEIHWLGSAHNLEYWLEAYRRQLHKSVTVVIRQVFDRQRAAEALSRLQMSFIDSEEAYGATWTVPKFYRLRDLRKLLEQLPARFESQNLIFRLREIERIEAERDLILELVPDVT